MLDICAEHKATGEGREALTARLGHSDRMIQNALTWGRKQGLIGDRWRIGTPGSLEMHIATLRKITERLEKRLDGDLTGPLEEVEVNGELAKVRRRVRSSDIASIAKQALDYRTRLLELEGLYQKSLEIRLTVQHDLSKLTDDELVTFRALAAKTEAQLASRN